MTRESASKDNAGHSAGQQLPQYQAVDRAKLPMKGSADRGEHESKNQIRANDLGSGDFRVVQEQNAPERTGSGGRETVFDPDGEREPGQPAGIFLCEARILRAWNERHAGSYGEHDSQQNDDDWISSLVSKESEHKRPEQEAGDRSNQKQPKISCVKVFPQQVEGCCDQPQDACEHERGAYGFTSGQSDDQNKRRNGEAAAANAGQTYRDSYKESQKEAHPSARFEKV